MQNTSGIKTFYFKYIAAELRRFCVSSFVPAAGAYERGWARSQEGLYWQHQVGDNMKGCNIKSRHHAKIQSRVIWRSQNRKRATFKIEAEKMSFKNLKTISV